MTKHTKLKSLHELLCALVDQQLTQSQNVQLQEMLKSSSDSRQYYLDFIDIHFGLRKLERIERDVNPVADSMHGMQLVGIDKSIASSGCESTADNLLTASTNADGYSRLIKHTLNNRSKSTNLWKRIAIAILATAAAIAIALLPFYERNTNSISNHRAVEEPTAVAEDSPHATHSVPDAILAQAVHASFYGELAPSLDSPMLANHEYALTAGMIELRFPTGATTIIEAPAVFVILSSTLLNLQTGHCSVHAPDGAEGFQVQTPLTRVVDLGTRFSVAVDETGGTDVHVVEGAAEVYSSEGTLNEGTLETVGQPVRLTDRQARIYSENGGIVSQVKDFDDAQYRRGLPDRVISYQANEPNNRGVVDLVELTVQRGEHVYHYAVESLIGIELTHFKSAAGKGVNPIAYGLSEGRPIFGQIMTDRALNTGVINPGGAVESLHSDPVMESPESEDHPNTPGMAVRFRQPIVNDVGPDIVLFDLQTIANPPSGDAFHIGPVSFKPGLRSHTVRTFDITMNSKEAKVLETFGLIRYPHRVNSLRELREVEGTLSRVHTNFRALAVGIDLSDLGYTAGETVESLFIQDALDDNDSFVDPTLIVGLPAIDDEVERKKSE